MWKYFIFIPVLYLICAFIQWDIFFILGFSTWKIVERAMAVWFTFLAFAVNVTAVRLSEV